MNFNKLPKDKRNQLIGVIVLTLIILGGLGFGLIKWQYDKLGEMAQKKEAAQKKLKLMQDMIKHADEIESELAKASDTLSALEDNMASGDYLSSVVNTIRNFKLPYKVEIPSFSQPLATDMNLLAKYPYSQVKVTIAGQAYYHDLGKFIADFENQFPHIRVVNLSIEPVSGLLGGEREKLGFTMDVFTLVKPTPHN